MQIGWKLDMSLKKDVQLNYFILLIYNLIS